MSKTKRDLCKLWPGLSRLDNNARKNPLKEPVMYLCLHNILHRRNPDNRGGPQYSALTHLHQPTEAYRAGSSLGLLCPRESLHSLQTAQSPILDSPLWEAKAPGRLLQLQYPWPHGSLCNAYCWFGSKAKPSMPSQLSAHCHSCPSSKEAGSIFLETMMS